MVTTEWKHAFALWFMSLKGDIIDTLGYISYTSLAFKSRHRGYMIL